ncbi:uroporphyrinogen-III synthase [Legionella nautarum]|uniref:Uroporphyrinogen-III synthase n=1 Tax=Legionella nautarum TaxID=45070 RepID=A0A0W0WLW2_9GAMM|nr:uroporphyrinogen-III synthase [Legionella nautarum]KTD33308.1 uroporphyrinogen-III synthase [Legionella nautarum]
MSLLNGLRVLNTRPLEQGKNLSQMINAAGGVALECPAITIEPTPNDWLSSLPPLDTVKKAIFVSTNAVKHCFSVLTKNWPKTIRVIAVGQATAAALKNYGIQVDLIPAIADSEHLLELKALQQVSNETILLFKGEKGRPLIEETLTSRGANLLIFQVYKQLLPQANSELLHSLWHNQAVDIILFTSQQAMHNIFLLFGEGAKDWLRSLPCIVISERLAKEATLLGMQTIIVSTPETLLDALHEFNQGLSHGQ